MIIFMYVFTTFICPQYVIIGLLVSAILENEADKSYFRKVIPSYVILLCSKKN